MPKGVLQNPHPVCDSKQNVAFLIDSNRANIDFHKLFPVADVKACSNVPSANFALQRGFDAPPTDILLHVGTNDVESYSAEAVAQSIANVAKSAHEKFECRVHVSKLLPRNDSYSGAAVQVNNLLSDKIQSFPNSICLIAHENIEIRHLRDAKHLQRYHVGNDKLTGSQLFTQNLYQSINNECPPADLLNKSRRWYRS